jgi:hypothetical protein
MDSILPSRSSAKTKLGNRKKKKLINNILKKGFHARSPFQRHFYQKRTVAETNIKSAYLEHITLQAYTIIIV